MLLGVGFLSCLFLLLATRGRYLLILFTQICKVSLKVFFASKLLFRSSSYFHTSQWVTFRSYQLNWYVNIRPQFYSECFSFWMSLRSFGSYRVCTFSLWKFREWDVNSRNSQKNPDVNDKKIKGCFDVIFLILNSLLSFF